MVTYLLYKKRLKSFELNVICHSYYKSCSRAIRLKNKENYLNNVYVKKEIKAGYRI